MTQWTAPIQKFVIPSDSGVQFDYRLTGGRECYGHPEKTSKIEKTAQFALGGFFTFMIRETRITISLLDQALEARRRIAPRPTKPRPISAKEAGSGTCLTK